MSSSVLDASVVLAIIKQEPGGAGVAALTPDASVSAVNTAEVMSRLLDDGYTDEQAKASIDTLLVEVVPFDENQALLAGALRPLTRRRGLSLGDRACLALASTLGLPVLTADRQWAGLDVGVEVRVIR